MIARNWNQATDRQLVDAVMSDGDERAFRELYQRYTPRLYRLIIKLLDNCEHEAEDVLQETWLRAAGALHGFRWSSSLPTWLSSIALNRAREVRRGRRRWADSANPDDTPAPRVSMSARIDLQRAISSLPDGYRSVYELYDVEGYTHEEIAERLGIKPGTSKSQLFHARRSLRGYLGAL